MMRHNALAPTQIDDFWDQGYLIIGKLLDDELVASLQEEYDRLFAHAREDGRYRNLAIDDTGDVAEKQKVQNQMLQITQMCERSILYRKLIYDDRILDIVENLIGPNIQLFHDQALYKPAGDGGPVFWHQDNGYWRCTPPNLVSCWLTLDDVNRENGAMHVIPGSHHRLVEHKKSKSTNALFDVSKEVSEDRSVVIDLPAGGVMFHHCQTLHFTPPNRTHRQRRAFAIHFMPPGTLGQMTDPEDPEGKRRISGHLNVSFSRPMLRARI